MTIGIIPKFHIRQIRILRVLCIFLFLPLLCIFKSTETQAQIFRGGDTDGDYVDYSGETTPGSTQKGRSKNGALTFFLGAGFDYSYAQLKSGTGRNVRTGRYKGFGYQIEAGMDGTLFKGVGWRISAGKGERGLGNESNSLSAREDITIDYWKIQSGLVFGKFSLGMGLKQANITMEAVGLNLQQRSVSSNTIPYAWASWDSLFRERWGLSVEGHYDFGEVNNIYDLQSGSVQLSIFLLFK